MKFNTSGDIHRMFIAEDKDTMITRNNVRRICLQSGIKHILTRNIIFVDADDFISKTNPYKIKEHVYTIPRLRNIDGCVKEWNKQRKEGERYIHADEIRDFLKKDTTVFKYKFRNRWIINYDQLEPYLKRITKTEIPYWLELVKMRSARKKKTRQK